MLCRFRDRFYKTPISAENFSDKYSSSNFGQITTKTTEIYITIIIVENNIWF
jgi:hypothetical protein